MRSDAVENRQRLLDAAEALFAERGQQASVVDIVSAAGVGIPTMYRHFGTKEGLIRAINERRSERVANDLARALAQPTGWRGLEMFVESCVAAARYDQAVRERRGLAVPRSFQLLLIAGWTEIVGRAHREGSLRPDFSPNDLPFVLSAITAAAHAADYDPLLQERYTTLLLGNLRAAGQPTLPGPAPTRRDVYSWFTPAASTDPGPVDEASR